MHDEIRDENVKILKKKDSVTVESIGERSGFFFGRGSNVDLPIIFQEF